MPCRRYIVRGSVQGVFFRASTQQAAQRLKLTGWVRNLPDGRVELLGCGEPVQLDALERWLWQGPPNARVENVVVTDDAPQSFSDFSIVR